MSQRSLVQEAVAKKPGSSVDDLVAATKLTRKRVQDIGSALVGRGSCSRAGGLYYPVAGYVAGPRGAAAHKRRLKRLPKRVRGFRAEARASKRAARARRQVKPDTALQVRRKRGRPAIAFTPAFTLGEPGDADSGRGLGPLLRASFAVVFAMMSVRDGTDHPALRHAMESHARALALLR